MSLNDDALVPAPNAPIRPSLASKGDEFRYASFPHYIFGLHDSGGQSTMFASLKPGWVVIRVQVNPPDSTGDFSGLGDQGLGVIACLTNGYGGAGTIPSSTGYEEFAEQCAYFVAESLGARIWVIGDEPNRAAERPGNDGSPDSGEVITPEMYARCFNQCRQAIRAVPGHESDLVIPSAVAPFVSETNYLNNPNGDWVRYFADILFQITTQGGKADGLALHTYTHGYEANFVTSEAHAHGHFSTRRWHFRAYRDFLAAVLPVMRNLPVFITQARPIEPGWTNHNRKWIQAACAEINAWNGDPANQPIQAVCFYRWHSLPGDPPGTGISDKPQVMEDWCAALQMNHRVHWRGLPLAPDYAAQWLVPLHIPDYTMRTRETISAQLVVKNTGASAWLANGAQAVQLGCFWYDAQRQVGVQHFDLPQNILPGQKAQIDSIAVQAPKVGGAYTFKVDLVQSGQPLGVPAPDMRIYVQAPPYVVEWGQGLVSDNDTMPPGSEITGTVTVVNLGSRTWPKSGKNPVRLAYRWMNEEGVELARAEDFEMAADTAPGETATFEGVVLCAPSAQASYNLRWNLYDGLASFDGPGTGTRDQVVIIKQDYAAKWMRLFEIPAALEPNEKVDGSITVQNVGALVWKDTVRLIYEWRDAAGLPVLTGQFPLAHEVPPDASATFEYVSLPAPVPQGEYTLAFQFALEGVNWASRPYLSAVTVHSDTPDYMVRWIETPSIPKRKMIVGGSLSGRVNVKNSGALAWDTGVSLGYRWYDAAGVQVPQTMPTFPLAHTVLPRETATFDEVTVLAPDAPGTYELKWDLYRERAVAFNSPSDGIAIVVRTPPQDWEVEYVAHDMPPRLTAGETTSVHLQFKNIGRNLWRSGGAQPVTLGYRWFSNSAHGEPEAQAHLNVLPTDVPPEDAFTDEQACFTELDAEIAAPSAPGTYRLHIGLFVEEIGWFGDMGRPALTLPVVVTELPAPTNLWRAEASHNACAAILSIDGRLDSVWASQLAQAPGMWFRVSFAEPRWVDGLAFRSPGRGHPFGYVLRVSSDGEAWQTLSTVAQGNTQDIVAIFAPCQILYAQVDLLAPCEEEWVIAEVQIHACIPWKATASLNDEFAHQAIDNDPATAWTTAPALQAPNQWFQLDLGQVETIHALGLSAQKDESPGACRVMVWNEAAGGWQKIAECKNNREFIDLAFAPVQTQYLNIQLLDAAGQPWAIRELQLSRAMRDWVGPTGH